MTLPRFSVNNPVLVNLFMFTVLIGGVYSGLTLVREMFPEARPNRIAVTTAYPGATPAEVEKGITLKIEERIKNIRGIDRIISTITEGRSTIMLELESGFADVDQAVDDVKAAIDAIPQRDFPQEALETQVAKIEPRFPVMLVSLYGELDDRSLKVLGDRLRDDILALPSVTEVVLSGTRKDEISVEVAPGKLVEYGLSFMDVAEVVAAGNLDLPGGQVRTKDANVAVRTLGEKDRGVELGDLIVRGDRTGRSVRLDTVATIDDGFEDVEVEGRFNGLPSINVTVSKTPEQDAIEIASAVRALVAGKMGEPFERAWVDAFLAKLSGRDVLREVYERARSDPYPEGVEIATHNDLSVFIEGRLNLLERNGMWGLVLVFLSLLMFLHWRVAFWVMMGLVLAITGSLICMRLLGLSLNLISMLSLIIVLGLLVDDAIIVSEHVYSKVENGMEARLAAITGTEEVTWPVVCAIVTTIVAFAPLMYLEGQMGDWMGVLPVVVCVALTVSLVEALTILPSHLAHGLRPLESSDRANRHRRLESVTGSTTRIRSRAVSIAKRFRGAEGEVLMPWLRNRYERLLRLAARYRYVALASFVACMMVAGGLVAGGHVPFVFLQKIDTELVFVNLQMEVGAPLSRTREALGVVERAALDVEELKTLFTLVGAQVSEDGMTASMQSHLGQSFIELVPSDERSRTSDEIVQQIRTHTEDIPGVEKLRFNSMDGGPGGAAIHLEITGEDLGDITNAANEIKEHLMEFAGVFDIVDDFEAGRPEVQIELHDSARALGLTTEFLATQVRSAFYGFEAKKIQRGSEDVRIMVRYPPEHRKRIYDIESMWIATPMGDLVPFGEVARITEGRGYSSIKRTDQRRTVTVTADVNDSITNAYEVMGELSAGFPELQRRYPGIELRFGGQRLETNRAFGSLRHTSLIALAIIFVILAGLFRSYIQPLIVMAVIPFGAIGMVAGHLVMGYPLTLLSIIGMVALTGIVVNDSMILMVFINRKVAAGASHHDAVIEAGLERLRPILLTSVTTVLGIAPLLFETSFQARFLIPMGISISAGLIFATALTLVAVPALYLTVIDMKRGASVFVSFMLARSPEAQAAER